MRPLARSLGFLVIFAGACSQLIGLDDYDKVDDSAGAGGEGDTESGGKPSGGSSARGGSSNSGGRASGGAATSGGSAAKGGRPGSGGSTNAGTSGESGAGAGGTGGTVNEGGGGPGGAAGSGGGGEGGNAGGGAGGAAGEAGAGGSAPKCQVNQELLLNPGFDAATVAPWTEISGESRAQLLAADQLPQGSGLTVRTAPRSAVLGGTGTSIEDPDNDPSTTSRGGYGRVRQPVTIPTGTKQLTLSCYYRFVTEETDPDSFDWLAAWLWDDVANETPLEFKEWSNLDAASVNTWQLITLQGDATNVAGNAYQFEFFAVYDDLYNTWFAVDNCSLKTTACY